jgi:hypothetical protein
MYLENIYRRTSSCTFYHFCSIYHVTPYCIRNKVLLMYSFFYCVIKLMHVIGYLPSSYFKIHTFRKLTLLPSSGE